MAELLPRRIDMAKGSLAANAKANPKA